MLPEIAIVVGAKIDGFRAAMSEAADSVDKLGERVDSFGDRMESFAKNATILGEGLTSGLTEPIMHFVEAAGEAAIAFDEASDRIRAKTGAVGQDLAGLEEVFKNVFASVPNSASDVSNALSAISVSLGVTGKPLEELTTQMLNLARVSESSIVPLTKAMDRAFHDWSISTDEAAQKMDFMFKVAQGSGIEMTKLTELVVQFGAPMRALGLDLETATTLLGRFEKEGVNIETVMPGLRRELGNFAKAGIDGAAGFQAVIDKIKGAKTEAEGLTEAIKIFGQRAATDMFRAIKEGRFDIEEMTNAFKKSSETINKAAEDTLSFADKFKIFQHQVEQALEPLGKTLLGLGEKAFDFIKPLLANLKDLAEAFTKLSPATQGWILALTAIAAAAGPVLIVMGQLAFAIGELAPVFGAAALSSTLLVTGLTALVGIGLAQWFSRVAEDGAELAKTLQLVAEHDLTVRDAIQEANLALASQGKGFGDINAIIDTTEKAVKGLWAQFKDLSWIEVLIPGLAGIRQSFHDLVDDVKKFTGMYPEMFKAAEDNITKLNNATRDGVIINGKLIEGTKAQYDAAMAVVAHTKAIAAQTKAQTDAAAAAKAARDALARLTDGQKDAEKQAVSWAKAQSDMMDRYKKEAEEQVKLEQQLMKVDDELGKSKLNLALSYQKGADQMKKIAETTVEILDQEGAAISAAAGNAFNRIPDAIREPIERTIETVKLVTEAMDGMVREEDIDKQIAVVIEKLRYLRQVYEEHGAGLTRIVMTQNDIQRQEIQKLEELIDLSRKGGKDVADAWITELDRLKTKWEEIHMDLGQAFKTIGSTSAAEAQHNADVVIAAFEKIKASASSTAGDMARGEAAVYEATLKAQEARGEAILETQKRHLDKLKEQTKGNINDISVLWDKFANQVGDATAKAFDGLIHKLVTGKGSFKEIVNQMWTDIEEACLKTFLEPVEKAISKFIAGSLKSLMGGEGFGGLKKQVDDLGGSLKAIFAPAKTAPTAPDGSPIPGAGGGSDAANAASGSIAGTVSAIGSVVTAISSVVGNFQMAHMNTALGRIEESTRKTWIVTGEQSDSMLESLHIIRNMAIDIDQRIIEISNKISDVIAVYLNNTYDLLKNEILTAIRAISGHVDAASTEQTQATQEQTDATTTATTDVADAVNNIGDDLGNTGTSIHDSIAALGDTLDSSYTTAYTDLSGTMSDVGDQISTSVGMAAAQTSAALGLTRAQIEQKLGEIDDKTSQQYADLKQGLIGMAAWNEKLGKWVIGVEGAKNPDDALKATQIFGGTQGSQLSDYGTPVQFGHLTTPGNPLGSGIPINVGVGGDGPGSMSFTPIDLRPPSASSLPTALQPGGMAMVGDSPLGSVGRGTTDADRAAAAAWAAAHPGGIQSGQATPGSYEWQLDQGKITSQNAQRDAYRALHPDSGYGPTLIVNLDGAIISSDAAIDQLGDALVDKLKASYGVG